MPEWMVGIKDLGTGKYIHMHDRRARFRRLPDGTWVISFCPREDGVWDSPLLAVRGAGNQFVIDVLKHEGDVPVNVYFNGELVVENLKKGSDAVGKCFVVDATPGKPWSPRPGLEAVIATLPSKPEVVRRVAQVLAGVPTPPSRPVVAPLSRVAFMPTYEGKAIVDYGVALYAPWHFECSWTIVCRELVRALRALGAPTYVMPWRMPIPPGRAEDNVLPRWGWDVSISDVRRYRDMLNVRVIVRISHPDSFIGTMAKFRAVPGVKLIGYTVLEADAINDVWRNGLNFVDAVWVTCKYAIKVFRKYGVRRPIYYVPHGVRTDIFAPENADPKLNERLKLTDKFVVLYVGRVDDRKNLPALIRAYKMVERDDTVLVIHGDKRPQDLKLIKGLGVRHVIYTQDVGYPLWSLRHEDLPIIYGLALNKRRGVFVLPSHSEGFGLPVIEAESMTLPVCATKWSAMLDGQIIDGKTGYLIPITGFSPAKPLISSGGMWADIDVEALADRLRALYADPDLCDGMGLRAREHVKKNWTWERAAKMALRALRGVMSD